MASRMMARPGASRHDLHAINRLQGDIHEYRHQTRAQAGYLLFRPDVQKARIVRAFVAALLEARNTRPA